MDREQSASGSNDRHLQQQQGQQPMMGGMAAGQMPRQSGAMGLAGGQVPNDEASRQAIHQIVQMARGPNSPEQRMHRGNPPLMAAFLRQRRPQQQQQIRQRLDEPRQQLHNRLEEERQGVGNRLQQWEQRPLDHPRQPVQQVGQRPAIAAAAGQMRPGAAVPAAGDQAQIEASRQALLQLMQTLRNPYTPGQQNQILHILRSNPPLMAAFIRQRQALAAQQQAARSNGGLSADPTAKSSEAMEHFMNIHGIGL